MCLMAPSMPVEILPAQVDDNETKLLAGTARTGPNLALASSAPARIGFARSLTSQMIFTWAAHLRTQVALLSQTSPDGTARPGTRSAAASTATFTRWQVLLASCSLAAHSLWLGECLQIASPLGTVDHGSKPPTSTTASTPSSSAPTVCRSSVAHLRQSTACRQTKLPNSHGAPAGTRWARARCLQPETSWPWHSSVSIFTSAAASSFRRSARPTLPGWLVPAVGPPWAAASLAERARRSVRWLLAVMNYLWAES